MNPKLDSDPRPAWWVFGAEGAPEERLKRLPDPPPWRRFDPQSRDARGKRFIPKPREIDLVNAALYLRRPLLITGKPGVGKTSLTYAVAQDLGLGEVLRWSITTSTSLRDGLYRYDAIARLQDASLRQTEDPGPGQAGAQAGAQVGVKPPSPKAPPIGRYLRLGPLGTAFAGSQPQRPRVLLIDEIDKSDIDLPNNLLHIFEEGEFSIPELERLPEQTVRILPADAPEGAEPESEHGVAVTRGRVRCAAFPLVIMTSNAEREFPPAFLRRCLKLDMALPGLDELRDIVRIHLLGADGTAAPLEPRIEALIQAFFTRRDGPPPQDLAADQLLNAVYMVLGDPNRDPRDLIDALWRPLSG